MCKSFKKSPCVPIKLSLSKHKESKMFLQESQKKGPFDGGETPAFQPTSPKQLISTVVGMYINLYLLLSLVGCFQLLRTIFINWSFLDGFTCMSCLFTGGQSGSKLDLLNKTLLPPPSQVSYLAFNSKIGSFVLFMYLKQLQNLLKQRF